MSTNGETQLNPPFFRRIRAQNLLSFGSEGIDLELDRLNVLIGPNGVGKSNFIDALSIFQAASGELASPVRQGGGVQDWIWKGDPYGTALVEASTLVHTKFPLVRHRIEFGTESHTFELVDESIDLDRSNLSDASSQDGNVFLYRFQRGKPEIRVGETGETRLLPAEEIDHDKSILSQRNDPDTYSLMSYLARRYREIRLYRDWSFGHRNFFRRPQRADLQRSPLNEDFSNLGVFLNRLRQSPQAKAQLIERLAYLYEGLIDFELNFDFGTVQVNFQESNFAIPGSRLSDGSLRYLCLLAILLDPDPPAFIAIEEPEMGMHPALIPEIADLLVDASTRTQLVVTTHSDILVSAFSRNPEAVIVCEKHEGQTEMHRVDGDELNRWIKEFTSDETQLGEMWIDGEIGGTRW